MLPDRVFCPHLWLPPNRLCDVLFSLLASLFSGLVRQLPIQLLTIFFSSLFPIKSPQQGMSNKNIYYFFFQNDIRTLTFCRVFSNLYANVQLYCLFAHFLPHLHDFVDARLRKADIMGISKLAGAMMSVPPGSSPASAPSTTFRRQTMNQKRSAPMKPATRTERAVRGCLSIIVWKKINRYPDHNHDCNRFLYQLGLITFFQPVRNLLKDSLCQPERFLFVGCPKPKIRWILPSTRSAGPRREKAPKPSFARGWRKSPMQSFEGKELEQEDLLQRLCACQTAEETPLSAGRAGRTEHHRNRQKTKDFARKINCAKGFARSKSKRALF